MALFKRKSDPISARARDLNDKIARLEAEIQRLADRAPQESKASFQPANPQPVVESAPAVTASEHASAPQPRLRSTAVPLGASVKEKREAFVDLPEQRRIKEIESKPVTPPRPELGTAKSDFGSLWKRFRNNFRGPATSNPKLVNYLAAGSIQGLRPLRYEKRVARNRFIVLSGILILLLWGVLAIFFRHH